MGTKVRSIMGIEYLYMITLAWPDNDAGKLITLCTGTALEKTEIQF